MKKEIIDQAAHFGVAFGLTLGFSWLMPLYAAVILTMAIAVLREMAYQHVGECKWGCRLDLVGFGAGCSVAIAVLI